ncbi:dynactin P62 subunit [Anopheles sinensis]|uniref:Dynactin P62 subunit n=1 Tax=Anopheles sinensis TaxID=74873 RepID=A0A084WEZ0_ANOSI|nr:dynactin P62 subunit [Anopheles sinensis]
MSSSNTAVDDGGGGGSSGSGSSIEVEYNEIVSRSGWNRVFQTSGSSGSCGTPPNVRTSGVGLRPWK